MSFSINDINIETLGMYFKKDGVYKELMKLPKPKDRFFNNWPDQHGKEYDEVSATVFEAVTYNFSCYLVAENLDDLMGYRDELIAIFMAPSGFNLYSETLGQSYELRYLDSPSFQNLVPIWQNGKLYCEFTLNAENNYKPTLSDALLVTEGDDEIITEDDQNIYVNILKRNF